MKYFIVMILLPSALAAQITEMTDIDSLKMWYIADSSKYAGGVVSNYADLAEMTSGWWSALDIDGTRKLGPENLSSASNEPQWDGNSLNGHAVTVFSPVGSADALQIASGDKAAFDFLHQGDNTIVMVMKITDPVADSKLGVVLSNNNTSSANHGFNIQYNNTSTNNQNLIWKLGRGVAGQWTMVWKGGNNFYVTNQWHVFIFRYDNGAVGDDAMVFRDSDTAADSTVETLNTISTVTATENLVAGASSNSGTSPAKVEIAEIAFIKKAVTNQEVTDIMNLLCGRYGISCTTTPAAARKTGRALIIN